MMRQASRRRGFTLHELMITVVIVGILAASAVSAYNYQIAASKTTEALSALGGIKKGVLIAFNGERTDGSLLQVADSGGASASGADRLCDSADPVPTSITSIQASKYQSSPTEWSGDMLMGWRCLRFEMSASQYFQYGYDRGASAPVTPPSGVYAPSGDDEFTAWARGDLDGDGRLSWLSIAGKVDGNTLRMSPAVAKIDAGE